MRDLRLTVHQTAPLLGETRENEEEVRRRILDSGDRDLLVFPELATTGYLLRSRMQELAFPLGETSPFRLPDSSPPVAIGLPERGSDELVYNSAILVHQGRILAKHRKIYLPTYGLFDEGRYFAAGRELPPVTTLPVGWKVGFLICEDLWHPGLLYLLAMQGSEVVLVLSAAPGRGDPRPKVEEAHEARRKVESAGAGTHSQGRLFSSTGNWTLVARTVALQYGFYLVVANRAGVEEGVTFAGESMVVGPDGIVMASAPQGEASVLEVTLTRQALRSARTPFAHLRDEDPAFLRRGLDRLLGEP